jgi:hypothetical protein
MSAPNRLSLDGERHCELGRTFVWCIYCAVKAIQLISWRGAVDALGRKQDADFLTELLAGRYLRAIAQNIPDHVVLNLSAKWGTGKTFLLDRWAADLQEQGWIVLRFNAWERDYTRDPLMSFVSVVNKQIQDQAKASAKSKAQAKKLTSAIARHLVPLVAKGAARIGTTVVLGSDAAAAIFDEETVKSLISGAGDSADKMAKELLAREEGLTRHIEAFRKSLEEFAASVATQTSPSRPLLLIVDELDRCRPNFAIDLLEVIKHVFSVPGVYTVISTDTEQLAQSAKGAYGATFDGEAYLRRFFDLQYMLPEPERQAIVLHLLQENALIGESLLLAPIRILGAGPNQPANVYRKINISSATPLSEEHLAMAMLLAGIAETIQLSNRELNRTVQLARAVVETHRAVTRAPPLRLHFFYLLVLCAVFTRDMKAIQSREAIAKLLRQTKGESSVAFYSKKDQYLTVADLFDEYQIESVRRLNDKTDRDPLREEIYESFYNDPNEVQRFKDYPVLVARCGQLV